MQQTADCSPDGSGLTPVACLGGQCMTQKLPCTARARHSQQGPSCSRARAGPAPEQGLLWLLQPPMEDMPCCSAAPGLTRAARFSSLQRYSESPYFSMRT